METLCGVDSPRIRVFYGAGLEDRLTMATGRLTGPGFKADPFHTPQKNLKPIESIIHTALVPNLPTLAEKTGTRP